MFSYETEYFLAIASTQNLNRAAQALFISASALSQFLSKLEKRLGVSLFVRGNDSLQLTEAGMVFYDAAKQVERIKSETMRRLEMLSASNASEIRIGTSGLRSLRFISSVWPILQENYPECVFRLSNDFSLNIYNYIADSSMDFGIVAMDYTKQESYQFFCLHHEEVGLLIPKTHRIAQQLRAQGISPDDPVDISICDGENMILGAKGSVSARICAQYFKQERFTPKRITHSFQTSNTDIVRISSSIGMSSSGYVRNDKDIIFQRLKNPLYYDLGILCRKNHKFSQIEKEFLSLAEKLKEQY